MSQLISEIWEGLCAAGLTEVMLYLPDNSAARCHWRDTAMIGGVRVALLADQERKIVRIMPVDTCSGIGLASPKGVDPTGHRSFVYNKIVRQFEQPINKFLNPNEAPEEEIQFSTEPPDVTPKHVELPPAPAAVEAVEVSGSSSSPIFGRMGGTIRNFEPKKAVGAGVGQGSSTADRGWNRA